MERMFCFTVGDVIAKRDPLGLFAQSDSVTAEELYDAYGEKIFRLTEEICRDGGWKKAHWTKILQAMETVFGPESDADRRDEEQTPSAPQKERIKTAREIQAAIFQSPAYYPELFGLQREGKRRMPENRDLSVPPLGLYTAGGRLCPVRPQRASFGRMF